MWIAIRSSKFGSLIGWRMKDDEKDVHFKPDLQLMKLLRRNIVAQRANLIGGRGCIICIG